ncbi:DUF6455 family protein [Azospirillum sp. ST 5-10]|uniref:DUF6455 family protein n=1 Tax=unclassified Azospirillum TaxID=2630922 RepID=UPI003F49C357
MEALFLAVSTAALLLAGVSLAARRAAAERLRLAGVVARLRPGAAAMTCGASRDLNDAVRRCRACPRKEACDRWLIQAGTDAAVAPPHCPNRSLVERIAGAAT